MTIPRLEITTHQRPAAEARGTFSKDAAPSAPIGSTQPADESAKILQAGKDFETVFLRQMLSALERTTKVGGQGPSVPGQQAYGSMIVEAVADAVAAAGGIGLGSVLAQALMQKTGAAESENNPTRSSDHGSSGGAIPTLRSSAHPGDMADFDRISPQGFVGHAVPRAEIRTSASPITGPLADRRIR